MAALFNPSLPLFVAPVNAEWIFDIVKEKRATVEIHTKANKYFQISEYATTKGLFMNDVWCRIVR